MKNYGYESRFFEIQIARVVGVAPKHTGKMIVIPDDWFVFGGKWFFANMTTCYATLN